jgi:hypothetical protein
MHFSLLLSQLPHTNDASASYGDMIVLTSQPHRIRNMVQTVWAVVSKLFS